MKMFSKKCKVEDEHEDDWGFYIDIENAIQTNTENNENSYDNQYNDNNYNLCRILQILNFSIGSFIIVYCVIQLF